MHAVTLACQIVQGMGVLDYRFLLAGMHWGPGERLSLKWCVSHQAGCLWLLWFLWVVCTVLCWRLYPTRLFARLACPVHLNCSLKGLTSVFLVGFFFCCWFCICLSLKFGVAKEICCLWVPPHFKCWFLFSYWWPFTAYFRRHLRRNKLIISFNKRCESTNLGNGGAVWRSWVWRMWFVLHRRY